MTLPAEQKAFDLLTGKTHIQGLTPQRAGDEIVRLGLAIVRERANPEQAHRDDKSRQSRPYVSAGNFRD